jgi:DNA-directed RNA polymerase subunit RPC12/RpoP
MRASGRVVGLILLGAAVVIGVLGSVWLLANVQDDELTNAAAVFGAAILAIVFVLPLGGAGIYLMIKGRQEAAELVDVDRQRKLLGVIGTRGQISIGDMVLELRSTRDQIQDDIHALVSRGLFTGYVDWGKGILYSVEASQLQGRSTCPNCGGQLELGGKGLIKCPYCGAEIFL